MKAVILLLVCCLLLCGCDSWMDGSYSSVNPHMEEDYRVPQGVITVSGYHEIRKALEEMADSGLESRVLSVGDADREEVSRQLDQAIRHVTTSYPMGAYALESMTYEWGTTGGVSTVKITAQYIHGRGEIQRIKHVNSEDAVALITASLRQYDAGLVLLVADYSGTDYAQLVADIAQERPDMMVEVPQVTVNTYPETGAQRVLELSFLYQSSRDSLRTMQSEVQRVFYSAAMYVSSGAEDHIKLTQLYSFLMERYDYTVQTSITPSYSLLCHGVGDSKAFATVYAAMCSRTGVESFVVSGTRAGEPWFWNIVCDAGVYYHVDLLASNADGGYRAMTDEEMTDYVWDYAAYPACGIPQSNEIVG